MILRYVNWGCRARPLSKSSECIQNVELRGDIPWTCEQMPPPITRTTSICPICNGTFGVIPSQIKRGRGKYCSKTCMGKAESLYRVGENAAGWKGGPTTCVCEYCGNSFEVVKSQAATSKYCSRSCKDADRGNKYSRKGSPNWRGGKVFVRCAECENQFEVYPSAIGYRTHCSKKCMALGYRKKVGEKSNTWQGGKTAINSRHRGRFEYREWREAVFARDNWTCQDCGQIGHELHAHHIFSFADFPEYRFKIWNGTTLCLPCHAKIHPILRRKFSDA